MDERGLLGAGGGGALQQRLLERIYTAMASAAKTHNASLSGLPLGKD